MLHASALAGACAGLVSSIVTCPLDVVKTRLQAQSAVNKPLRSGWTGSAAHPTGGMGGGNVRQSMMRSMNQHAANIPAPEAVDIRYEGLTGIVRKIWNEGGVRGFYRGLGPTIFGYLPTWAIYFTVYDNCKSILANTLNPNGEEDFFNHILSAMTAGMASTCATSPVWVVKTRFMLQSNKDPINKRYRHTGDAFVQIYKTEGWKGFYRGLLPSLFGVTHVAVQFPLYEMFKNMAREHDGVDDLTPGTILTCSSSAKMIASVLTYPHEVLRTRLQMQPRLATKVAASTSKSSTNLTAAPQHRSIHTDIINGAQRGAASSSSSSHIRGALPSSMFLPSAERRRNISNMGNQGNRYTGVVQACSTIAREEGFRGFYRGMGVNLVRTVPSSALTILTYEVMMQHLTSDHHDADDDDEGDVSYNNK